jgi:cytochrome P450
LDAVVTRDASDEIDLDFFFHHFNPYEQTFADQLQEAIPDLLDRCPVARSDDFGGFWVVSSYAEVMAGYQDWRTFSSAIEKNIVPLRPGQPVKPPIDLDPPLQRRYRQLLNPFLTPARVATLETHIRTMIVDLIEEFIDDGQVDLARQFSRKLPARMLYRLLFGIEDTDVPKVQEWLRVINYDPRNPKARDCEQALLGWIRRTLADRRAGPRQDDMLDALLHADIDGELVSEDEAVGTVLILILGGFGTTADMISSVMLHLAQREDLQHRLRSDPGLIPFALDEFLRFEPPVSGQSRICRRDTVIGGEEIKDGDRVFFLISAANRDPAEFDQPEVLDIDRSPNRHLAFGIGPHRCIGSNVARLNLRVSLEELLGRTETFHITPGERVRRDASVAWGPAYLPLTFTSAPAAAAGQDGSRPEDGARRSS